MNLDVLVVTKYKWKSRLRKHNEIKALMGIPIRFSTVHIDVGVPEVKGGRITEEWFEKNVSSLAKREDYNFVIFQCSERDGKKWKLEDGLRGHNFADSDLFGEAWVCCDEDSIVKFSNKEKRDKYTKVIPHEIAHELKRQGLTKLEIHDYDYKGERNNIEKFYQDLNTQITLTERVKELTRTLGLTKQSYLPLGVVTQAYGVADAKNYPITGHHVGTDYRYKLAEEVPAIADLEVIHADYSEALGYWCECRVDNWYLLLAHLMLLPALRKYRRGETVAKVGKHPKYPVHLHAEGWNRPMNRSLLTKDNWQQLTFDLEIKLK